MGCKQTIIVSKKDERHYYINASMRDKYCYPDSDILVNLLNLRDANTLAEAEFQDSL